MRDALFQMIKEELDLSPEYPFSDDLETAVFRHPNSKKWFAIFMRVRGDKLGFADGEVRDVVNVKRPPMEVAMLLGADGTRPAYHMNKEHWITLILNDALPAELIYSLVEGSYQMVVPKVKGAKKSC